MADSDDVNVDVTAEEERVLQEAMRETESVSSDELPQKTDEQATQTSEATPADERRQMEALLRKMQEWHEGDNFLAHTLKLLKERGIKTLKEFEPVEESFVEDDYQELLHTSDIDRLRADWKLKCQSSNGLRFKLRTLERLFLQQAKSHGGAEERWADECGAWVTHKAELHHLLGEAAKELNRQQAEIEHLEQVNRDWESKARGEKIVAAREKQLAETRAARKHPYTLAERLTKMDAQLWCRAAAVDTRYMGPVERSGYSITAAYDKRQRGEYVYAYGSWHGSCEKERNPWHRKELFEEQQRRSKPPSSEDSREQQQQELGAPDEQLELDAPIERHERGAVDEPKSEEDMDVDDDGDAPPPVTSETFTDVLVVDEEMPSARSVIVSDVRDDGDVVRISNLPRLWTIEDMQRWLAGRGAIKAGPKRGRATVKMESVGGAQSFVSEWNGKCVEDFVLKLFITTRDTDEQSTASSVFDNGAVRLGGRVLASGGAERSR